MVCVCECMHVYKYMYVGVSGIICMYVGVYPYVYMYVWVSALVAYVTVLCVCVNSPLFLCVWLYVTPIQTHLVRSRPVMEIQNCVLCGPDTLAIQRPAMS